MLPAMRRRAHAAFLGALLLLPFLAAPATAQTPSREATRGQLRALLATAGQRTDILVDFHQSTRNEWNFAGSMTTGLKNCDSLEIVVSITDTATIGFRVYPH